MERSIFPWGPAIEDVGKVVEILGRLVFPSGPAAGVEGKLTGDAGKLVQAKG